MRLEIDKDGMRILPETPQDATFLKHHYGCGDVGDTIVGKYVSHFSFTSYGTCAIQFKETE